ncbi:TPA: tyrosine-type recombinase/integrase [Methanosarcina acetivorans]|uniref:Site-specific recombinase n=2 Tax=Methanosarcina acetivorans TaxID=2214 RepID=Q8TNQ2_METAC|nr:site-specific integrase [Methanosarcina acetivorans]AAM05626.1 site-specific recombinase [Methanosarcina acetivorans C2A]HIH94478.1 tyrosine-type recombinase/integrase [Methanosarcina acetivorans]
MGEITAIKLTSIYEPPDDERLISLFTSDCIGRGYSKRTIEGYVSHAKFFLQMCGVNAGFTELEGFLVHIRDERQYTLATCNNYFASLSTFFDFLEFKHIIERNNIPTFRKRYLRSYKKYHTPETRQLITIEDMAKLVKVPGYPMYQALIIFLAKTGIRRNELITLDRADIDLEKCTVRLKKTAKRSNRIVFFDSETKVFMEEYLNKRHDKEKALFIGKQNGHRIQRNLVYNVVTSAASSIGLHNPDGRLEEHFTPHCCRHWFTTWLRRSGMERTFIQELRGDSRGEAIDVYDHIEKDELREAYLKCIPQLGIKP